MLRRFFQRNETTPFDGLIDEVLDEMSNVGATSDEYQKQLRNLERLQKIKVEDRRNPVSRDTIANVAGSLLGILLIMAYEQKHVMATKGFSLLPRPK